MKFLVGAFLAVTSVVIIPFVANQHTYARADQKYIVTIPQLAIADPPPAVNFQFGVSVSPGVERTARDALANAQSYMLKRYGLEVPELTVYVDFDGQKLLEALQREHAKLHPEAPTADLGGPLGDGDGRTVGNLIAIRPRSNRAGYFDPLAAASLDVRQQPQRSLYQTMAHEYFHVLQESAIQNAGQDDPGLGSAAAWLTEGTAEVAGWGAAVDRAQGTLAFVLSATKPVARLEGRSLSAFQDYSAFADSPAPFPFVFTAGEYLVERFGDGAVMNYFYWLGATASSEDAFRRAFGLSTAKFISEFDLSR